MKVKITINVESEENPNVIEGVVSTESAEDAANDILVRIVEILEYYQADKIAINNDTRY